jgi:hypothetical protein
LEELLRTSTVITAAGIGIFCAINAWYVLYWDQSHAEGRRHLPSCRASPDALLLPRIMSVLLLAKERANTTTSIGPTYHTLITLFQRHLLLLYTNNAV